MYLSFYHLKRKPFQISTDPRFLWLGEKHEEALATLRYGVLDNKGFLLLTGDVGTGKTTLINTLLKTLGEDTLVATIRDPELEPMDFFNYIVYAFGMEGSFTSKGAFLIQFEKFLHAANNAGRGALLIIDEAQRINQKLLEEVRLLSNIEKEDTKLLNIFFIGQIEFNDILLRPENRAIRQRITVNYTIPALSERETGQYIRHRLKIAGSVDPGNSSAPVQKKTDRKNIKQALESTEGREEIFTAEAIKEIHTFSQGYPRLINIICDRSLLTGFVEESKTITRQHVKECAKELKIPRFKPDRHDAREVARDQAQAQPLPAAAPQKNTDHRVSEGRKEKTSHTARNYILAAGILVFLIFCYFGFSKYGAQIFQDERIKAFLEGSSQPSGEAEVTTKTPPGDRGAGLSDDGQQQNSDGAIPVETGQQQTGPGKKSLRETAKAKVLGEKAVKDIAENNAADADFTPRDGRLESEQGKQNEQEKVASREIQVKSLVTFEKLVIPFPTNSNLPPADSLEKLNMLAESLLKQPFYRITVTGFTDSRGNEGFNEKLSEFRANAVKIYLVGRGLEESRIITQGLGSQHPLESNDTYSGRMANRRVEIKIDQ